MYKPVEVIQKSDADWSVDAVRSKKKIDLNLFRMRIS